MRKLSLWAGGLALGVLTFLFMGGEMRPGKQTPSFSSQAPERRRAPEKAVFRNLEGRSVVMPDGISEPTLIVFWASW